MIKVELTNASNGIVKRVIDTQFNGADQSAEIVTIYEIDEENPYLGYPKVAIFLADIIKDLAIDAGSDHSPAKLIFDIEWGDKYNPSIDEVNEYLKYLRDETKAWKGYKRVIESNPNVNSV